MRQTRSLLSFGLAGLLLSVILCPAQDCDKRISKKKTEWGKSQHPWIASVFHDENIDIEQTWCRIGEAQGYDHIHKAEDFGRAFFTGVGLHPSIGSIAPGSGLAGGLQLNLGRATS